MKKIKLAAMSLLVVLAVSCEKGKEVKKEEAGAEKAQVEEVSKVNAEEAPVLSLDEEIYDLGEVQAGKTVEKTIAFKNTGKTPLIVKKAKASCGCTIPEYSDKPVAPGEEGSLVVKYTAPAYNGSQMKSVTLTTNTVEGRESFRIKANVVGGKEKNQPKPKPVKQPTPNL